jgi:hypothetical protein
LLGKSTFVVDFSSLNNAGYRELLQGAALVGAALAAKLLNSSEKSTIVDELNIAA